MHRIVLWALSTLSVLVLLFSYHTSTSGAATATPPSSFVSGTTPGGGATRSASGASSGASSGPSSGAASSGRGSGGRSAKASSRAPSKSPSKSPAAPSRTFTGDVAQTQWGPVQVQITVANGSITRVSVPTYPSGTTQDTEINDYALPILIQETTQAQSAQIDMVSGATVTSTGYLESLQSAIDRAGL